MFRFIRGMGGERGLKEASNERGIDNTETIVLEKHRGGEFQPMGTWMG